MVWLPALSHAEVLSTQIVPLNYLLMCFYILGVHRKDLKAFFTKMYEEFLFRISQKLLYEYRM